MQVKKMFVKTNRANMADKKNRYHLPYKGTSFNVFGCQARKLVPAKTIFFSLVFTLMSKSFVSLFLIVLT